MRNTILILGLLFTNLLYSQFNISDELNLQKRPHSRNEYCVQTINNLLNNSSGYFQMFLQRELSLSQVGEQVLSIKDGKGTIESIYMPPIISSNANIDTDAYKIYVKYYVYVVGNDFFVESLDIYGNWETVAKIFISYYPTTLNLEYLTNNKTNISSYYIEDKAVFYSYFQNGRLKAKIEVRTTSDKKPSDIISVYEEKKAIYDSIQEEIRRKKVAFLDERASKVYRMRLIDRTSFLHTQTKIENKISFIDNYSTPLEDSLRVILKFDTAGNKSFFVHNEYQAYQHEKLINRLNAISIKPPLLKGYNVATSDTFTFKVSYDTTLLTVKNSGRKLKLKRGTSIPVSVQNFLHNKHNGIYTMIVKQLNIDENISSDIEIIDYKKRMDIQDFKVSNKTRNYVAVGSGILLILLLAL